MRRAFVLAAVVALVCAAILLHSNIRDFLWTHPWWHSFLVLLPTIALPVLAYSDLRHSAEANELRIEANRFRDEANDLRKEANRERTRANEALARIADHTKKSPTKSERNAEKLQKYLRSKALVINADDSRWGEAPEIVEIKDEVVTLFTPCGFSSSAAMENHVHCEDLEIVEAPVGSLSLTLKVLKRYGASRNLGEIKTWEERLQSSAAPLFSKGTNVFSAEYVKAGSQERRRLSIFESADGSNHYMLLSSPGETVYGDSQEISRKFLLAQLEFQTQGFRYGGGGSGGSKHELFINTRN
jgi:hypothetical protein